MAIGNRCSEVSTLVVISDPCHDPITFALGPEPVTHPNSVGAELRRRRIAIQHTGPISAELPGDGCSRKSLDSAPINQAVRFGHVEAKSGLSGFGPRAGSETTRTTSSTGYESVTASVDATNDSDVTGSTTVSA